MARQNEREKRDRAGGASHRAKTTTNHAEIQAWIEKREGQPATVKGTARQGETVGMLRVSFPGHGRDESLQEVTWEDFFAKFDQANLAFLYQDTTEEGGTSRFFKFVRRR
jgi:hypothetical protein